MRSLHSHAGWQGRIFLPDSYIADCRGAKSRRSRGLARPPRPGVVQQAFIDEQAAQCGYCIAGMVMRAQALLERNPSPSEEQIRDEMTPNLCRCGTHMRILRAVRRAARIDEKGAPYECATAAPELSRRQLLAHRRRARCVVFAHADVPKRTKRARPRRQPKKQRCLAPCEVPAARCLDQGRRGRKVTAFTGKAKLGQGMQTALIQIAADQLAVPPESLELITADTGRTPNEGFTAGSHSMQDSGTAILQRRRAGARGYRCRQRPTQFALPVDQLTPATALSHAPDGGVAGYGPLICWAIACMLTPQPATGLSDPAAYRLIGKVHAARRHPGQTDRRRSLCAGYAPARHAACPRCAPA